MNVSLIPQNILRWMNAADRKRYAAGQLTKDEAIERFIVKDERGLHKQYHLWLTLNDLDFCHSRMDKKSSIGVGISDFHVWKGVRHCFIEFKSQYGRLRPEQEAFIARQCERGTPILVTTSFIEARDFTRISLGLEPRLEA
jgi:hypothetical protein